MQRLWPAENLVIEDIASPDVKAARKNPFKAAGLNFPDTLIIQGKYQFQPPMPFSPVANCPVKCLKWAKKSAVSNPETGQPL